MTLAGYRIEMLDSPCDRCGRVSEVLYAFHLSETITYRRREIRLPWLCVPCLVKEKDKWWKARRSMTESLT